jgi:peptidoglycan/LPS O-acetylase OafA/YrhL
MDNLDILNLYNIDTSEMSGAGGKGNSGRSRSNNTHIKSKLKGKLMQVDSCDKALLGLYFVLLLLVLIMVGNLMNTAEKGNSISWILFTLTIVLGIGAMYCIYKGDRYKKLGLTIIAIANAVMLFIAMLMSGTKSSGTEKFSAHLANVLFAIVSVIAAVVTP